MRSQIKKPFKTLLILLFPLLFSCATTLPGRQYTQGSVIDAGPYSLIGPPGDGWSIETGKGTTSFYRRNIPPGSDQIILNYVGDNFDQKKGRYSSEEEVALEFINFYEELTMKNAKEANCVTNDMKKGTTVIGEKKLYFISSVATGCTVEAASRGKGLYIFFPVDFSEKHSYYVFSFLQFRDKGTLEGIDLKLITSVIDSLKIKEKIEVEPKDAKTYYQMGLTHVQKGDFDQAILYFNKTIEMDPKNSMAYNNRGSAYAVKGQYDRAISDWTKALEIDPKYAGAYYNRGNVFCRMGQYDKAISDLNKAIEIDPRHAGAYTERGIAYQEKGQNDQAISDYNKALEINPNLAVAYYNRGLAYGKRGQYDQEISDYNKALELNPRYTDAYCNRGIAYYKKGQHDQAISDCNKALEINPRYTDAYYNRGSAYRRKGQHDQAIADYSKVLEIDPRYAGAYFNRGVAYYFKKEYDKSWDDIKKAQDLGLKIPAKFLDDLRKASGRQN